MTVFVFRDLLCTLTNLRTITRLLLLLLLLDDKDLGLVVVVRVTNGVDWGRGELSMEASSDAGMISLPMSPKTVSVSDLSPRIGALIVSNANDLPRTWRSLRVDKVLDGVEGADDSVVGFSSINNDRKSCPEIMSFRRGTGLAIVSWVAHWICEREPSCCGLDFTV